MSAGVKWVKCVIEIDVFLTVSSVESVESVDGSESVLRSWGSHSSLADVQRVPSYDSFEEELGVAPLGLGKQGLSFKDYVQERNEPLEQGKAVIPAAVLAGFTGASPSSS